MLWVIAAGIVRGGVHVVNEATTPLAPVQVVVDTRKAWGDGRHPSTALCLEWLSAQSLKGQSVLDMGCGTGVLAIAAAKLGAHRTVGVDIDDEVIEAATANARKNDVDLEVLHARGLVPGYESFDYVVANILVGQLSRPSMVASLALSAKSKLCLSGVRPGDQCDTLRRIYDPYFHFDDIKTMAAPRSETWGTWACLHATRRPTLDRDALLDAFSDAAAS
ncbi:hypothetical protein CTAYLR_007589 [Chrysophaeum taylorii]|uniref:ETFB lysine methyltransferase n=1 Tax=Chrysophaeum taylorii TaxID=2483200 RepID=A0AAD7XK42_9STRA|nr:hypothetical protein CTAYLR_007589 [Chrysophaeum taylorii]